MVDPNLHLWYAVPLVSVNTKHKKNTLSKYSLYSSVCFRFFYLGARGIVFLILSGEMLDSDACSLSADIPLQLAVTTCLPHPLCLLIPTTTHKMSKDSFSQPWK
jgi:hypothetical protein